jgi:predicted deacylase
LHDNPIFIFINHTGNWRGLPDDFRLTYAYRNSITIIRTPDFTPVNPPAPAATPTTTDTPTPWPTIAYTEGAPPAATVDNSLLTRVAVDTAVMPPGVTLVGRSVEGRGILAHQFGNGERILLLVGGIHGGWEANTVELMDELRAHFRDNPDDVLTNITLIIIPAANPDGLARGREEAGRFNANGVDLNRNWACEWSTEAVWREQKVNPGERAFSEPESQALAAYIRQIQPRAVLFYHSAARGIFAGNCAGDHGSMALSQVLGEATGYRYGEAFTAYRVTGTAASWVDGQGIPSADVELSSWTESQFDRNLSGVMAVQRWLSG